MSWKCCAAVTGTYEIFEIVPDSSQSMLLENIHADFPLTIRKVSMNISVTPVVFAIAIHIAPVASAAEAIPPPSWGDNAVSATTARDPVLPLRMGPLEIILEKTSLEKVRATIGLGKIYKHGDASEALAWLCYTATTANSKQRLWLSSGEMGGLTAIDGITAVEIHANDNQSESCPELPQRFM
ncbi:MAG: hypothetical protein ACXWJK_00605, partial [Burkholderiaceae bacterium]